VTPPSDDIESSKDGIRSPTHLGQIIQADRERAGRIENAARAVVLAKGATPATLAFYIEALAEALKP
jgi:hypothetical protein